MKNNKKGFTIVELVVVIAVIAILAAVLIPTFSSITNSARESAAMQEAKSGMDSVLALTQGTMPEDSAFVVAESNDDTTNDYTFVFHGNKLQNAAALDNYNLYAECRRNDVATADGTKEGYIVYVSVDAMDVSEDSEQVENGKLQLNIAQRILAAIGLEATLTESNTAYTLNGSQQFALWTYGDANFNIYWTSDFSETLIAFMGGNVTGTVTPPDADETVTLTYTDSSTNNITAKVNGTPYSVAVEVEKGKAVTIELSATVEAGKIQVEIGGTAVTQDNGWTLSGSTITIEATKVTGDINVSISA